MAGREAGGAQVPGESGAGEESRPHERASWAHNRGSRGAQVSMENRKEEQQGAAAGWMTVPAFGDWDVKNGAVPDYSMDFSKIREMRKQNKRELSRASLGGDEDLLQAQQSKAQAAAQPAKSSAAVAADDDHRRPLHGDSPTGRKKFLSYFQCCIRA
ncbi:uncharacterized protein C2845_PM01G44880 [Panicum miliaceum]|uniref:RIN4 pathogenic type III effector avirulence factor Avr cleavage site domain-containing protein n=1 Tax=Panicum miliaceum TaxID=4540 RepID=A0A3L6TSD8_PANMI|nr:uncharacterized protein C2845_PM01G44880 [Panicum miliaceum]